MHMTHRGAHCVKTWSHPPLKEDEATAIGNMHTLKFGIVAVELCEQTDRHTHHNTSYPSRVWSNNNNCDDICSAIVMAGHCESSCGSLDECRLSARWPLSLKPSQPICSMYPPLACYHPRPPLTFFGARATFSACSAHMLPFVADVAPLVGFSVRIRVCVLDTWVNSAKTAEPSEMPFGRQESYMMLDGVQSPNGKGQF